MERLQQALFASMLWMLSAIAVGNESGSAPTAGMLPGTSFEKRQVKDSLGREVTFYVSRPKAQTAPLVLMIQGSGCVPVMNPQGNGTYSTLFNLLPFGSEGQFTVLAVEKPFSGVVPGRSSQSGTAQACSAEFNEDFTAERWLVAIRAALDNARRLPYVDKTRTLAMGMSEGAVMAALLAAQDGNVTDVVSISGSGTTQLFDFLVSAYRQCADVSPCLADVESRARAIQADPNNASSLVWGHPHKRWASFFRVDATEQLLQSKARIYLAFGTADEAVPVASHELAVARLMAAGREPTVRRIPNANHALMLPNQPGLQGLDKEFRAALAWFAQGQP